MNSNFMQLFYNESIGDKGTLHNFSLEESKHICTVLRKKEGDLLQLTDGKGGFFEVVITSVRQKKCEYTVHSYKKMPPYHDYKIHLAVAPTKSNTRFEWLVEKTCELGIDRITPVCCKNSERKYFKKERSQKIAISAIKQSKRFYLPEISDLMDFKKFVTLSHPKQRYIAYCGEFFDKKSFSKILKPSCDTLVLIGPEGDFSKTEIGMALQNGFIPISLGTMRLRTESAAVFACNTIHVKNEIFN